MGKKSEGYRSLSREELSELAGEELPERAAMSLVNANIAIPVNAAVAANVLSDGAIAYADAAQNTPIDQGN
ncbi:MAG: hypothetical protein QOF27_1749 [Gaiellaceae bacterium]|jgi:hypothetical protein|nr:hypothetical protein [Gaiellaceae bacterium]